MTKKRIIGIIAAVLVAAAVIGAAIFITTFDLLPEEKDPSTDLNIKYARESLVIYSCVLDDLKDIYAIGGDEMPAAGYSGKRPHVHMILNGGIDRDTLERIWAKGRANCDRLQPRSDGLGGIAVYFTRQKQDRPEKPGVRKWRGSRNLKQPVRRSRDARMPNNRVRRIAYDFRNEAKEVMEKLYPGYVFQDCTVRYSDIVDGVYIRCVLRRIRS